MSTSWQTSTGCMAPVSLPDSVRKHGAGPCFGSGTLILLRACYFSAEHLGRVPSPMRIVEHGARERDHVCPAFRHDRFCPLGGGNKPHDAGRHAALRLYGFRKRHVHVGDEIGTCIGAHSARGHANEVHAHTLEGTSKHGGISGRQPSLDPVMAGDARPQRHALRDCRAHAPGNFERKAHAALEGAAILVVAFVGDGREEAVQQIPVRPPGTTPGRPSLPPPFRLDQAGTSRAPWWRARTARWAAWTNSSPPRSQSPALRPRLLAS